MRESIRHQIETALGTVGLVASAVSILEVAAPRTVEAAGVGTTLGGLLLIPGAFLIGTTIREDQDRREAALNDFMIKLYASVVSDALERALDKLNGKGPKLNEGGRRAVSKIDLSLRDQMSHDISYQLFLDSQMHIYSGDSWQALYEKWMNGYAEDLYKIYSDPKNVDSPADNRGGTVGARKLFWPL